LSGGEKRKTQRIDLSIPIRVQGFHVDGSTWEETATTDDISVGGAGFVLKRPVELGQVLLLILPLPKRLRQHNYNDAVYRVYGLVRGIQRHEKGHRVGAMFFGQYPPRGFHERPSARFLLPSDTLTGKPAGMVRSEPPGNGWTAPVPDVPAADPAPPAAAPEPPPVPGSPDGRERRGHPRLSLFVNFTLQQVDEWGVVLQEELTVADNVSQGGAHVMTTLNMGKGDVILLQEAGGGFATRAEIRGVTNGTDNIKRLHLKFLDRRAPERLLGG
jgi:hypothetical protein